MNTTDAIRTIMNARMALYQANEELCRVQATLRDEGLSNGADTVRGLDATQINLMDRAKANNNLVLAELEREYRLLLQRDE